MALNTLYTPGQNENAILDTMIAGPYCMVDVALRGLEYLLSGALQAGPYGWQPRGFPGLRKYAELTGGGLENLWGANLRLLHQFSVVCLYDKGDCDGGGTIRVRYDGSPASRCENFGIPSDTDNETRIFCLKEATSYKG